MANDEQVKAVLKFKRDAILSRQWDFVFEMDTELSPDDQKARVTLMKQLVAEMKGSFTDSMAYIMRAMRHGFSINEKIFDMVELDGAAYYACVELRPKPPFTFYFKTDTYGTMTEFGQNFGGQLRALDLRKFVHYVQDPEEDQWYGRSELRAAYRSWYMKDVQLKMQALWLERMAGGFLSVTPAVDAQPATPADLQALNSALANVKNVSGLLTPPGYKVEVVQPNGNGDAFSNAINYHDLAIAKALLVPNLLGVSNNGGVGSYSQSQTQLESFFWTLNADSNRLESVLDNQLFQDLYEVNFGDGNYPCFRFKPASEEFIKWVVGQWVTLTGANDVINTEADEAHLRAILNMPPRGPDDKPLITPAQKAAADAGAAAKGGAAAVTPGGGSRQPAIDIGGSDNNYKRVVAHTKDGKPLTCSVASFSRAAARVAFSVIATRTEAMSDVAAKSMAGIIAKAVGRALKDVPELIKNPVQVQDVVFDKVSMGKLKAACVDALGRGWDLGTRQANNEIDNARKVAGKNSRRVFSALRDDSAAGFLDANGFRMAGNLADGARAIIQQELLQAIKAGQRPELAASQIYQRLIDKGFTDLSSVDSQTDDDDVKQALQEAVGASTEAGTLAYLNTLTRTNIFEAMNESRYAAFTDPELDGFVEALEYSAILDDRTTEICQALDGYTADSESDTWDTFRPPNHYNALAEGSLITTATGLKPIEQVVAGEMVLTHRGRFMPAYAVMRKTPDEPKLLSVKLATGRELRATKDHPVLTIGGWKRADELQVGDVLFENVEQMAGVGDVLVANPKQFPSLFDQPLVPYEIVSDALRTLVSFTIKFDRDPLGEESKVEDVAADDVLELELVAGQESQEHAFKPQRVLTHRRRLARDDRRLVGMPGIVSLHPGAGVGTKRSIRPMPIARPLGDDGRAPIGDPALGFLGAHGDAVALAPTEQHGLSKTQAPLDRAHGFATGEVALGDDSLNVGFVSDVHWRGATIITIADVPSTDYVWNLAVLDDESYVAESLIVHNCRSVLIPVTQIDGWDGTDDPTPDVEPQAGFGAGTK